MGDDFVGVFIISLSPDFPLIGQGLCLHDAATKAAGRDCACTQQ